MFMGLLLAFLFDKTYYIIKIALETEKILKTPRDGLYSLHNAHFSQKMKIFLRK